MGLEAVREGCFVKISKQCFYEGDIERCTIVVVSARLAVAECTGMCMHEWWVRVSILCLRTAHADQLTDPRHHLISTKLSSDDMDMVAGFTGLRVCGPPTTIG